MATTLQHMKVTPLSPAMGAAVTGINAADLDNASFKALRDALHEHLMLAVRDQALDPAAQTAFTQRFGEIQ
jgi:alpha-ketoglutarate-dependent taurine dioxygenase